MAGLTRAREAAVDDLKSKHQQVLSLLLRLGRHYPGKRTWSQAHMNWLASQKLDHPEQRIAFEEMLLAVRQAQERIARLEQANGADLWEAAGFLGMTVEMLDERYGHHHPDFQHDAARAVSQTPGQKRDRNSVNKPR